MKYVEGELWCFFPLKLLTLRRLPVLVLNCKIQLRERNLVLEINI